jgi:hypothetical protein
MTESCWPDKLLLPAARCSYDKDSSGSLSHPEFDAFLRDLVGPLCHACKLWAANAVNHPHLQ